MMDKEIQDFRQRNGNVNYSIKELLYGLNTKVDKLTTKIFEGENKIAKNREVGKSAHKRIDSIDSKQFKLMLAVITAFLALGGGAALLLIF